ncbi:MAG: uridine kinase [Lachnospiraceae bacterium]|nr:uridine kinase [Lachnospiraceae bacterium]
MKDILIVGIAGGSASGKTTVVNRIKEFFGDGITVIGHDNYYKAHDDMTYEERTHLNYDHPNAFDTERMIEDVKKIKAGEIVDIPVYDYGAHNRSHKTQTIMPQRVVVLEGILLLYDAQLRDLMDVKIFVDAPADERLVRRIKRDMAERERSLHSVLSQYQDTVRPMHEQFVEPTKAYADVIIPRGGENHVGIGILRSFLEQKLKERTKG